MTETPTCYMCNAEATSREHCPPRVFFPTTGDAGFDSRRNLLTVPSCHSHNSARSADDEYVAYVVAMQFSSNHVGEAQASTRTIRALDRSPGLQRRLLRNHRPVVVNGEHGGEFELDKDAFDRVMGHTARGLHYVHTGRKLLGPVVVNSPNLVRRGSDSRQWLPTLVQAAEQPWELLPQHGAASVFRARWLERPKPIFELTFYEHFTAFVVELPTATGGDT